MRFRRFETGTWLKRRPPSLRLEHLVTKQLRAKNWYTSTPILNRMQRILLLAIVISSGLPTSVAAEVRAIDGTNNNLMHAGWGAAGSRLLRMAPPDYADGMALPGGAARPNPRTISNALYSQANQMPNDRHLSNLVWQWGQFLDHDISLSGAADPAEHWNISVPAGDVHFDPMGTGAVEIPFQRTLYDPTTGTNSSNARQQVNEITAFIDASNVYGSDARRAELLRTFQGGKLATRDGGWLIHNTMGMPNANGGPLPDGEMVLAGDVRANEQVGLTSLHTIFVREHNRLADELANSHPNWADEQLYQHARKIVGAQMQSITFNEFLPALLGPHAPSSQASYELEINAGIANEFSSAIYRLGHTMLSPELPRIQSDGTPAPGGHLALRDAFFNPSLLEEPSQLEFILKGMAATPQQEVDTFMVDDVRNFMFGPPGAGGLDLASLNIQRGRDHGLPDYNELRVAYGLEPVGSFADISSDATVQSTLESLYGTVDNIDPWVGALAEDHMDGASLGPLAIAALVEQFERLRDGDRFWYEADSELTLEEIAEIQATTLGDIILRNTLLTNLQANVFLVPEPNSWLLTVLSLLVLAGIARRSYNSAA